MGTRGLLLKLFALYRGEGKKAACFALFAFLTSTAVLCGVTLSDGLFLEEVGSEGLPLAFFLTATAMLGVSAGFLQALSRLPIARVVVGLSLSMLTFYLLLMTKLFFDGSCSIKFWYVLKVVCYMYMVVSWTSLWTFIDQYYDLQDAKRLYGLFNAALITGCAAGSCLVSLLVNRLPLHFLLLVIAAIVATIAMGTLLIARYHEVVSDDTVCDQSRAEERSVRRLLRNIIASRFTLFLLLSSITLEVLSTVTEFNYMHGLASIFQRDHDLTLFLSRTRAIIYVANVLFGLFFYGRLVKRFGANNTLLLPTLYFTLLFSGWSFSSGLVMAVLGLIAVEGVLYALDDSNFNLLINAVPAQIKARVRVLIESFFEPAGMLISSVLLMALRSEVVWLGLTLAGITLLFCLVVRKRYSQALFANLSVNAIHFDRRPDEWIMRMEKRERLTAQGSCLASLEADDPEVRRLACISLLTMESEHHLSLLLRAIGQLAPLARDELLNYLLESDYADEEEVLQQVRLWALQPEDKDLRGTARLYLARLGELDPEEAGQELHSSVPAERAAAIVTLQATDFFERMLHSGMPEEAALALSLLPYMKVDDPVSYITPFLHHPLRTLRRSSMRALEGLASEKETLLCLDRLRESGDSEIRLSSLRALAHIDDVSLAVPIALASIHFRPNERRLAEDLLCDMGGRVVPSLLALLQDEGKHDRCRLLAGRVVGRIALPQLQAHLLDLIRDEIERAYFYFYHYATVQRDHPQYDLHILEDGLLTGYHSVIDFIIQMLGVSSSVENCELLSHSLRSHNHKIHGQAVETLHDSCDRAIFELLEPLVDDRPLEEKLLAFHSAERRVLSLEELLERLEESSSLVDPLVAKTLRSRLLLAIREEPLLEEAARTSLCTDWLPPLAHELAQ